MGELREWAVSGGSRRSACRLHSPSCRGAICDSLSRLTFRFESQGRLAEQPVIASIKASLCQAVLDRRARHVVLPLSSKFSSSKERPQTLHLTRRATRVTCAPELGICCREHCIYAVV